jgi:histidyl-tRNA synthetase
MWSHYGDSHRGYCLQYSVHTDPVFVRSVRVGYASEYPVINWLSDSFSNDVLKCVTQKDKCWEYESEWRYIRPNSAKQVLSINSPGIKSVIIGAEEAAAQKSSLKDLQSGEQIEVALADLPEEVKRRLA